VFTPAEPAGNPDNHWLALIDGWDTFNLRTRLCDNTNGRWFYMWNLFCNVFGKVCSIGGCAVPLDVPQSGDGRAFVDLANLGNNPLRDGNAVIHLSLAQADRVTVKIYDVSGRLVRTLADRQLFQAGRADPALTWDGLDDRGRGVSRGAYFVNVRYERSRYEIARKMIGAGGGAGGGGGPRPPPQRPRISPWPRSRLELRRVASGPQLPGRGTTVERRMDTLEEQRIPVARRDSPIPRLAIESHRQPLALRRRR
jgi:hypothetical protein